MKVRGQTRALLEAVNLVSGVVSNNATRPVLQSVLVKADDSGLLVQGTDLEVGLTVRVDEVEVEEPGSVAIPANRFHAILREAQDAEIRVASSSSGGEGNDSSVEIETGRSRFNVATDSVDEFPAVGFTPAEGSIRSDRQQLLDSLRRVSVAAAKDATRFQMHSVLFDCREGKIRLVSTDGKRMALEEESVESSAKGVEPGQYIVPLKGVDLLMKILSVEEDDQVELHLDQNEITYSSDRVSLSCRLVEGRFPEYERAVPEELPYCFDLSTSELQVALKQAMLMTTKDTNSVQFAFDGDCLVLSTRSSNVGESRIELQVEPVEAPPSQLLINFNPGYLLDLVRVMESPTLRARFKDRKTAGLFGLPDEDGSYRHIVMPLVTQE